MAWPVGSWLSLVKRIRQRNGELVFDGDLQNRLARETDHRVPPINDIVGGMQGKDIVDVGCWTGAVLRDVHESGALVCVGIDLPGPWLDVAKENVPSATFIGVPSLGSVPESLHGCFDAAIFLETLEHLPTRTEETALRSIGMLLRSGGTLVLSTPAAGLSALLDPAWYLTGHRHYSVRRLRRHMSACSLSITAIYYSGGIMSWIALMRNYVAKYLYGLREPGGSVARTAGRPTRALRTGRGMLPQSVWVVATAASPRASDRKDR